MPGPTRIEVLRATERFCERSGVDALSLAAVARLMDVAPAQVAAIFHDETSLLDAVLERHQARYERAWEERLPSVETARAALHLLVSTIAARTRDDDGGPAYVAICAQMCTSPRFSLTGRPATTTPAALKLIGKLMPHSLVPFPLIPARFERFALVMFGSIIAWHRQGQSRMPEAVLVEELVDCLSFLGLTAPSDEVRGVLDAHA